MTRTRENRTAKKEEEEYYTCILSLKNIFSTCGALLET